jgi:uncharacterized membrane-anchored protein
MRLTRLLPFLFAAGFATAQDKPSPDDMTPEQMQAAYEAHVAGLTKDLRYQEGTTELPGGIARLELPAGYRYLDAADAKKIVVDLWGNPPQAASDILGMVVPAGEQLTHPGSWAIILSFEEDGYVSDKDADEIDYDDLLSQLQEQTRRANESRKTAGYDTMELTGWAVAPRYDKKTKALYWAKRLNIPGEEEETLNYDVRVLGRRGVLSLNGVAGMGRVGDIETASPSIVSMVKFNDGHRYADFNPDTDKEADYSLAGLVLGGAVAAKVAGKVGLLAKLGALLVAGKKFVIFGAIGLAVLVKKILGRKSRA